MTECVGVGDSAGLSVSLRLETPPGSAETGPARHPGAYPAGADRPAHSFRRGWAARRTTTRLPARGGLAAARSGDSRRSRASCACAREPYGPAPAARHPDPSVSWEQPWPLEATLTGAFWLGRMRNSVFSPPCSRTGAGQPAWKRLGPPRSGSNSAREHVLPLPAR